MDRESKIYNCDQCKYIKIYDYGKRLYYCDHVDRNDDMGKLGVGELPERSPKWCPLKCMGNRNQDSDLIKMKTDIQLTDGMGNPIEIKVPQPEYRSEIFS